MRLTFAFYKAKGTWVNKLIRWRTQSKYSHVEVILPDGNWFSMGTRWLDGFRARFKHINPTPGHWDYIDVDVHPGALGQAEAFAAFIVGAKYDWAEIFFTHLIPLGIDLNGRYTCSAVCNHFGTIAHVPELYSTQPHKTDPGEIFNNLVVSAQYQFREG